MIALLLAAASTVVAPPGKTNSGCDLAVAGIDDRNNFELFFQHLQTMVRDGDAAAVAKQVFYPLRVNGPGKKRRKIKTPAQLVKKFAEIFTPKVRAAIVEQRLEALFCNGHGVMFGNGQAWAIIDENGRVALGTINR